MHAVSRLLVSGVSWLATPAEINGQQKSWINFAVLSRNATKMTLCLAEESKEVLEVDLLSHYNKTGDMWHIAIEVPENLSKIRFGWKADGSYGWEGGSRFHPKLVLLDPYSKIAYPTRLETLKKEGQQLFLGSLAELSRVQFDWGSVKRPRRGYEQLVISELDLTALPKPVLDRALEKTAIMAKTGINVVVLRGAMLSIESSATETPSPFSFFAPNCRIFSADPPTQSIIELKSLIKSCHENSMEVFLEIQFCFTSDDTARLSLKGVDVNLYFRGKGILNCGHPVVQELIINALRYWAQEFRIDGFVFSNAETMVQDRDGTILDSPPLAEAIALDPILRRLKLIAASGNDKLLPREGKRGFPHWGVWTEYNTKFRSDFWEYITIANGGKLSDVATRLTGSADLFGPGWEDGFPGSLATGRRPAFGLNSPVRCFGNLSNAIKAEIEVPATLGDISVASRDVVITCSLLTAIVVSQGIPVFPQDCWDHDVTTAFIRKLIAFRERNLDLVQPQSFHSGRGLEWHGTFSEQQPQWDRLTDNHFISCSVRGIRGQGYYVAFNTSGNEIEVQAPNTTNGRKFECVSYSTIPNAVKNTIVLPLSMFQMSAKSAVILEII